MIGLACCQQLGVKNEVKVFIKMPHEFPALGSLQLLLSLPGVIILLIKTEQDVDDFSVL